MALDEPNDNDEVFEGDSFTVLLDKGLAEQIGGVKIDFRENRWMGSGFLITPANPHGGSCC
jgi:Fe-S cluster assembly iron-binding protein IscA